MIEVPSLELTTSFLMANLCPSPPFCFLPFHKALPKTCLIFSYNIPPLRHRHFHTVFASSVKKAGTTKKVMTNADLCKNIREFVNDFGFPEGHVPSMKELSHHGRQDLANIVRRRGYKMLRDLLATSAETDKNEFDTKESFTTEQGEKVEDNADDVVNEQGEKVRDSTKDILLQSGIHGMRDVIEDVSLNSDILLHGGNEASVAVSSNSDKEIDVKKYPLHIEHDEEGDVANEYLRSETGSGEQEEFCKDVSNLPSVKDEDGIVLEDFSSQTKVVSFLLESSSNNADIVRTDLSLQTQNDEVGAVVANITSLRNEDDIGIHECDSLQSENDEGVNIDVFPSCHQDNEKDVAKDSFFDSENVPEDIYLDSENHHPLDEDIDISSSGSKSISKSPNDETCLEEDQDGGELKLKENEIAASDEYMKDDHSEIVARLEPLSSVPKVVNGITSNILVDSTSHPENWYYNNDHENGEDSSQAAEFEHLKFMLRKKEMELAGLKKLIEKEQLALSTLQSETELKIKEAQQLILEKDAELQSAEETLSDLQEVEIQFHVDGETSTVELAGSFNGWHHRVKMDQLPSESSKLRSGQLWTTVLWLYPGIYEIKFIVDGYWKLDPNRQVLTRGHIQNNILQVVGKR
ncbi:protein PTST homolog 3, chloroplastic [Impatiens glandulifera]|uniref:protein PTST homolog 3, chloroplastic n=1 Tax=Impatiens glandulifera TaxID=253017 RepID=UPI001FB0D7C2|nr:protein PTST homolog 3, chloroplastic [Impatiens glandulifera]